VASDFWLSIAHRLLPAGLISLSASPASDSALYNRNHRGWHLTPIQQLSHVPTMLTADEDMHISQFVLERASEGEITNGGAAVVHMDWAHHHEPPAQASVPVPAPAPAQATESEGEQGHRRSRRRRRGGGGGGGPSRGGPQHVRRPPGPQG